MTREEAVANLRTIKEYFEEESGATPICLEYAIEALKADVARWSSWNKTFEQSGIADLISRADALMELNGVCSNWEDDAKVAEIIHTLPSANTVPIEKYRELQHCYVKLAATFAEYLQKEATK